MPRLLLQPRELPPEVLSGKPEPVISTVYHPPAEYTTTSFFNVNSTSLRETEKHQILKALEQTGWHRGRTADMLGISPSTLYRRLRDYGLDR